MSEFDPFVAEWISFVKNPRYTLVERCLKLANRIGLDLLSVDFTAHFLVKYSEEMILDPFNKGRLLDIEDLQEILDSSYGGVIEFVPDYLNEIEPEKILVRIARNLKNSYTQSFNYTLAMRCVDMILELVPDSPEEIRDKGILQSRLFQNDLALRSLDKYLELAPEANDADFILDLIRSIKEKSNQ